MYMRGSRQIEKDHPIDQNYFTTRFYLFLDPKLIQPPYGSACPSTGFMGVLCGFNNTSTPIVLLRSFQEMFMSFNFQTKKERQGSVALLL